MEHTTNHILLRGTLARLPQFSHENHAKRFYSFELEVERVVPLNAEEGINIFICHIRNVLKNADVVDSTLPLDELMRKVGAVRTTGELGYWSWDGRYLGGWHEPAQQIKPGVEVGKAAQM